MKEIFQNFENEIIELYKAYKMAHFSLYNMESTFYDYKRNNPQINYFVIKDKDFNDEITFYEEEITKNRENGNYQRIIAGNTISMFYNIWEDKFRLEIAKMKSLNKNDIKSNIFKELNYIRQSITHNNFNPSSRLNKLEKLSFVGNSNLLKLTSLEVYKIKELLLKEIKDLKNKYCN